MIIYRVQHRLEFCHLEWPGPNGVTHGPTVDDEYPDECNDDSHDGPTFGFAGNPPYKILPHEYCAVTKEQFPDWISHGYIPKPLTIGPRWELTSFEVTSHYRIDNNQVVFDPQFATRLGEVTVKEVLSRLTLIGA